MTGEPGVSVSALRKLALCVLCACLVCCGGLSARPSPGEHCCALPLRDFLVANTTESVGYSQFVYLLFRREPRSKRELNAIRAALDLTWGRDGSEIPREYRRMHAILYIPVTRKPERSVEDETAAIAKAFDVGRSLSILSLPSVFGQQRASGLGPYLVVSQVPLFHTGLAAVPDNALVTLDLSRVPEERMRSWLRYYFLNIAERKLSAGFTFQEALMLARDVCSHLGSALQATAQARSVFD